MSADGGRRETQSVVKMLFIHTPPPPTPCDEKSGKKDRQQTWLFLTHQMRLKRRVYLQHDKTSYHP